MAARMPLVDRPLERFLILNGMNQGDALTPGEKVKIVTEWTLRRVAGASPASARHAGRPRRSPSISNSWPNKKPRSRVTYVTNRPAVLRNTVPASGLCLHTGAGPSGKSGEQDAILDRSSNQRLRGSLCGRRACRFSFDRRGGERHAAARFGTVSRAHQSGALLDPRKPWRHKPVRTRRL